MSEIKLSKCLFVDLQTDEQRRDWFSIGRGVATGIIAPALQPHLTTAYSKIVESKNLIEQLRQRNNELAATVERLKADLKIVMPVIDELVQSAVEPSDIYADDLQDWLIKAGVLKVVPFDPRLHYDYTHETQDGQDWITWSDWYETKKEQSK